jgi:hypothetical protein
MELCVGKMERRSFRTEGALEALSKDEGEEEQTKNDRHKGNATLLCGATTSRVTALASGVVGLIGVAACAIGRSTIRVNVLKYDNGFRSVGGLRSSCIFSRLRWVRFLHTLTVDACLIRRTLDVGAGVMDTLTVHTGASFGT